jgi:hypothetical protein
MTRLDVRRSSAVTGARVGTLIVLWLAVVYLAAAQIGLYYEPLAIVYVVPPLALIDAYCLSHRSRATAYLAVAATIVAVLIIGFAIVIPKGSAA